MKLQALLDSIHEGTETSTAEELARACKLIVRAQSLTGGDQDTLHCLFKHGPCADGDVPSKSSRDELLQEGFVAKVVVKGSDGFNALTYRGRDLHHIMTACASDDRGAEIANLCHARIEAIEAAVNLQERVKELEDVLSSARCIAQRAGEDTHWGRFEDRLAGLGISGITAKVFRVLPSDEDSK